LFDFAEERVEEGVVFVFGTFFEVEAAIGAGFWAKGDVEVDVFNHG
jgi:hypothetical protein